MDVSVIVPVYNVEDYITKCLKSLDNQTLDNLEIIIVNDGSKDKSKEKIENFFNVKLNNKVCKFTNNNKNYIYLEKENGGLSDARNFGIKYATSKYIAFLDSDDYAEKNTYEKLYEKARKENLDYVECNFVWKYPKKEIFDNTGRYKNLHEMIAYGRVVAWNKLIKKDIAKDLEFPKGLIYEDINFFYKLVPRIKSYGRIEDYLINYVQRDNSLANKHGKKEEQIFEIFDDIFSYYKQNGLFDDYKQDLEYSYTRILLCSSFKRICKISDKKLEQKLIEKTWDNLNKNFPNWKDNKYLKEKNSKNFYMKLIKSKDCLNFFSKFI